MSNYIEPLEVNGNTPLQFIGYNCEALFCQEYWFEGTIVDTANVTFLKFGGKWCRLYFDYGIVFWRNEINAPKSFQDEKLRSQYLVSNIGLKYELLGKCLSAIELRPVIGGSEVTLSFECGALIAFQNINDVTTISVFSG
jgi:hypothetical protein